MSDAAAWPVTVAVVTPESVEVYEVAETDPQCKW